MHCGINAYVKDGKVIKIEGIDGHPSNDGRLCTKGLSNRQYLYREDRILTPLKRVGKRGEGKFEPITWDEAYAEIAKGLNAAKEKYGAESVAFYSGYSKWLWPGKWLQASRAARIWPTATCSWAGHSTRSTPLTWAPAAPWL